MVKDELEDIIKCKVTIHPGFSGTVPIFNDVSQKKSQFSRYAHLSRLWLDIPDLSQLVHLCSHMLMHRWPNISSDFICIYKKSLVAGALPWIPLDEFRTLPHTPSRTPTARVCSARTLRFSLQRSCRIAVPKLRSP